MILEAFADYLHNADPAIPARQVLEQWLCKRLSMPPLTNVDRILHSELTFVATREAKDGQAGKKGGQYQSNGALQFKGKSASGKLLCNSLYEYCQSYEQQRWSRLVHTLKASDFAKHLLDGKREPGN